MHYHGFMWRGPEEQRARHRAASHIDGPGFRSSDIPPIKTCWWLRRPAHAVRGTWDDADGAVGWMAGQYADISDVLRDPEPFWKPDERRREAAIRDLSDGRDVAWGYLLDDGERAFIATVCCSPNAWEDIRCPLASDPA
ncbi:hypothetical protein ACFOVU_07375 [Nocardiopsis sediminis]|uniref:Uncharacterized protein n=1 Tax=Nocardiopsis sediminis TaxID=1778267 RepID=A0ABV8FK40_9ACTN